MKKKNPHAVALGRIGGSVKSPRKARTPEQARKAVMARWGKIKNSKTHHYKNPTYIIWHGMICRCNTNQKKSYPYYKAKGIKVCDRWRTSFDNFVSDMGQRPSLRHSIDRIDGSGNYEPNNCRWVLIEEQARNQKSVYAILINGVKKTIGQIGEEIGIKPSLIYGRLCRGWSIEKSITTPLRNNIDSFKPLNNGLPIVISTLPRERAKNNRDWIARRRAKVLAQEDNGGLW